MAKREDLKTLKEKTVKDIEDVFNRYSNQALQLSQTKEEAEFHEFQCYFKDMHSCVEKYDAFRPTLFSNERILAKKMRDCTKACYQKTPHLEQFSTFTPETVAQLRELEEGTRCLHACVDAVSSDFKRIEEIVKANNERLIKSFKVA